MAKMKSDCLAKQLDIDKMKNNKYNKH